MRYAARALTLIVGVGWTLLIAFGILMAMAWGAPPGDTAVLLFGAIWISVFLPWKWELVGGFLLIVESLLTAGFIIVTLRDTQLSLPILLCLPTGKILRIF
jgi:hypothetical protein